jgi:phosphate starvation-inducible protein PhoH and related proteins
MAKPNRLGDNSIHVEQREKIKEELKIRPFKWTEKQQKFIDLALRKDISVMICKSPPGCGKTLLSLYCCLELLNRKAFGNIIFYRNPVESASKGLGFLSGDYFDKIAPYGEPLQDHLKELLDKSTIDKLFKEDRISIDSIGFAKGRTHNTTGIILDESEDLTLQELELIMGRMGRFSKLFIIGDERQANVKNSGFSQVFKLFSDEESLNHGIATFEFISDDCMRNPILKFIIGKFENLGKK